MFHHFSEKGHESVLFFYGGGQQYEFFYWIDGQFIRRVGNASGTWA